MPKKATHQGNCQWCGAVQKLPNNVLANHGYKVQWSMFQGICVGSGHLPLQLSCELVKKSIVWAKEQEVNIAEEIEFYSRFSTSNECWMKVRDKNLGRYWDKVKLLDNRTYITKDGKEDSIRIAGFFAQSVLETATELNKLWVKERLEDLNRLRDYIKNQESVVQNWKIEDLIMIKQKSG